MKDFGCGTKFLLKQRTFLRDVLAFNKEAWFQLCIFYPFANVDQEVRCPYFR